MVFRFFLSYFHWLPVSLLKTAAVNNSNVWWSTALTPRVHRLGGETFVGIEREDWSATDAERLPGHVPRLGWWFSWASMRMAWKEIWPHEFFVISATNFKQVVPTEQWAPCLLVLCFSIFLHTKTDFSWMRSHDFSRLNSQQQVCWVQNTWVVEIWGFVHQWIVTINSAGQHNLRGEPPNESHWIFWLMGEIGLWPESDSKTGKTKNQNEACEQWSKPTQLLAVYRGLYYPVM